MRGGKRQGAGRPAGTPNRATEAHKARICDLAKDYAEAALEALVSIARNDASEATQHYPKANLFRQKSADDPKQLRPHLSRLF
jgi:phage gp46-like protein